MSARQPWYKVLYIQVLIAIALGVLAGWLFPDFAKNDWINLLGRAFVKLIKLIKMAIMPIIFCTIVSGIAHIREASAVGRVGVKALVYFELVSTLALVIGIGVGIVWGPGHGFPVKPLSPEQQAQIQCYVAAAAKLTPVDYLMHIIPDSVVGAFVVSPEGGGCGAAGPQIFQIGDVLQVLFFAILFGFALMKLGDRATRLRELIDEAGQAMFGVIAIIMKAAPIGAFGAMAFTIGRYGPAALGNLINLIATFYVTSFLFVVVALGLIARIAGFSILKFLRYIREELLIVLGASSSESALPLLMTKLERLGCSRQIVGLVVPTGYSFNLDGTNIYMTLATLFIAQALHVDLSWTQLITILIVAMLTSKGASGVTGAGFVTLAGTLAAADARLAPGLAIIFGNGVACVIVAWWEKELNRDKLRAALNTPIDALRPLQTAPLGED